MDEKGILAKSQQREEKIFLEGPHSRLHDFVFLLKIVSQFIKGLRAFHFVGPCATVFGSARINENHHTYKLSRQIGSALADLGFTVVTGGGPGAMEAANRGAKEVGGRSIGCNIVLPNEQRPNDYLDKWVNIKYFFVRKVLLVKYSYAFVVLPGGFGTMDEFFEAITLVQTFSIKRFPIVIMDTAFYAHLMKHFESVVKNGFASQADLSLFLYTDSIDEAIVYIQENSIKKFGLEARNKWKPSHWLGERRWFNRK